LEVGGLLKRKRRVLAALVALSLAVLALAGCGKYESGTSFREEYTQDTPEGAVMMWMGSMEWIRNADGVRDPSLGRNFEDYYNVSSPVLFPDNMVPDSTDWYDLKDAWNSTDWEVEFLDIQLETVSQEGDTAVVRIVGGQTRYIGKEIFGTTEYKVDDYHDKPGEITLQKIDGKWRVIRGAFVSDDEYWEVEGS
jgi:hypothetical protein